MYQNIILFTCSLLFGHCSLKYILDEKTKAPSHVKYYLLHFITNMYVLSIIYKKFYVPGSLEIGPAIKIISDCVFDFASSV